ncbi:MAG: PHP domain-containing protein [Clostridia bacterium]|nr:PHP domain-containing protein [Clostridia bacterium]
MRFVIDHDYHLHSNLSPCAQDPLQTPENMLKWAERNGLKEICLTDHFWDEDVKPLNGYLSGTYRNNGYAQNSKAFPLPQSEKTAFHFGCEGEMDFAFRIGITPARMKDMAFVIIPTTHMHMRRMTVPEGITLEQRAVLFTHRFNALLNSPILPAGRTGIAHLVCSLIAPEHWEDHLRVLEMVPDSVLYHQFRRAKERNFGVELNIEMKKYSSEELQTVLRPFLIAKECGCKFYLGSDAHTYAELDRAMENFDRMVGALDLSEDQKYHPSFGEV